MRHRPGIEDETLGGIIDRADLPALRQMEADAVEPQHWLDRLPLPIALALLIVPMMAVAIGIVWLLTRRF